MREHADSVLATAEARGWLVLAEHDRWSPPTAGQSVVIVYAPWSHPDVLAVRSYVPPDGAEVVIVCVDHLSADRALPDVAAPHAPPLAETPFVAEYRSGLWQSFRQGPAALLALSEAPAEGG